MAFDDPPRIQAHICVNDGHAAIAFYVRAFGAACTMRQLAEDGRRILHANLAMLGGEVMLHDEFPEWQPDVLSPVSRGGASMTINVNLSSPADVDAVVARAVGAGALMTLKPGDMFWGARYGRVRDPFGHVWAFNAPLAPATMKLT